MVNARHSKYSNIARPYALATFEYARNKQDLPAWKAFLGSAATLATQPEVTQMLSNPEILPEKFYSLFCDVLASVLNEERKNFLHLLAQNHRFAILPSIADTFDDYYAALEKTSRVRMVTAIPLAHEIKDKFARALSKRTQSEVTLECEVNPSILGGAIIHIGDHVIDGSVRGKLTRLGYTLCKSSN